MTEGPNHVEVRAGHAYAVITGDVVKSTALQPDDRRRLIDVLEDAGAAAREVWNDAIPMDLNVFAGDSWQMLVATPHLSLRIALFIRASLIEAIPDADTRFVIGVGNIDFIPPGKLGQGEGSAFQRSGRRLADMGRAGMAFVCPERPDEHAWDAATQLIDAIITRNWTQPRARAVIGALQGWKQHTIATLWSPAITQASVANHLDGAAWRDIAAALQAFEEA